MANTDKNIVITPNTGSDTSDPTIRFTGGNATVANSVNVSITADGTLSFNGSSVALLSVRNTLSGTLFSVNNTSGNASIEVTNSGVVRLARLDGNVGIGTATVNAGVKLAVFGGNIQLGTSGRAIEFPDGTRQTTAFISPVAVNQGGTGLTSGTSGGIPYFSSTSAMTSSALLAANALMVGGGAGAAPATITTGTGVVTALGVNTGTAGAFVVNGGALGTPSSGTLTNCTGLPVAGGGTGTNTFTTNGILYGNGTSAVSASSDLIWNNSTSQLLITSANAFGPQIQIRNNTADANGPYLMTVKARGTSGAGSAVQVNDALGTLIFVGADSNGTVQNSSYIQALVTAVGAGSVSSYLNYFAAGATGFHNFVTNNNSVMRINSSGNVGIGTSTIATGTKLYVSQGNVRIGEGSNNVGILFSDGTYQKTAATGGGSPGGTTGAIQYNSGSAFAGNSSVFFFDSATNRVGIGTNTVSSSSLTVKGDAPTWLNTTNSGAPELIIGTSTTTGLVLGQTSGATYGYIKSASSEANPIIAFTSTGVGIKNVTAPVNALDVAGGVVIGGGIAYAGAATAPSNGLLVQGSVGIGELPGASKLKIQRAAGANTDGELYATDGTYWTMLNSRAAVGAYNPLVQAGDHSLIYSDGSTDTGSIVIGQWSGSNRGVRINNTGDVGIGTSTIDTGTKLYVSQGNVRIGEGSNNVGILFSDGTFQKTAPTGGGATITDDTTTNATRYIAWEDVTSGTSTSIGVSSTKLYFNPSTGTLNATIFNSLSDETLKTNIAIIPNPLDILKELRGVTFNWRDNNEASAGLIAQDVERVMPSLVKEDADQKTLNYNGVIGLLTEAVKSLNETVNNQQREIAALKQMLFSRNLE